MLQAMKRLVREEEGQGMVEYALILALVAIICIVGYRLLGNAANNKVTDVKDNLT